MTKQDPKLAPHVSLAYLAKVTGRSEEALLKRIRHLTEGRKVALYDALNVADSLRTRAKFHPRNCKFRLGLPVFIAYRGYLHALPRVLPEERFFERAARFAVRQIQRTSILEHSRPERCAGTTQKRLQRFSTETYMQLRLIAHVYQVSPSDVMTWAIYLYLENLK